MVVHRLMSDQEMALVAPMPIAHDTESTFSRFNRRTSDMAIVNSPLNNHRTPQMTLESLAAELSLLGSSPTGTFNYLTGDIYNDNSVATSVRAPMQKSRSFPSVRRDDPMKSCVQSRPPLRKTKSVRFADSQGLPLVATVHQLKLSDSSYTERKIVPYDDDDALGKVQLVARPGQKMTPCSKSKSLPNVLNRSKSVECPKLNKKEELQKPAPQFKRQNSPNFNIHKHEFGFTQPSLEPDFFERVNRDHVVLESVREEPRSLHGIVRVANISYEKEVNVRWTHDNWRTSHDTQASFCSHDGGTDRFAFELPINGDDVIFAIRFRAQSQDYWDNNRGKNYIVYSKD